MNNSFTRLVNKSFLLICIFTVSLFSQQLSAQDNSDQVSIPDRLMNMSVSNLMQEANSLYDNGDYDAARPYYLAITKKDTTQAGVYKRLAEVEYQRYDLSKSLEYLRTALELEPNNEEWRARFNTINQVAQTMSDAQAEVNNQNYDEAIKQFESVLDQYEDFAPAYYSMGLVNAIRDNTDGAVEHLERAVELDPENQKYVAALENLAKSHFNDGVAAVRRGNLSTAEEEFNKVIQIDENFSRAYYMLGYISRTRGNINRAIELYQSALEINPQDEAAWYALGIAYRNVARNQQALDAFTKASDINGNYSKAWHQRGEMLRQMDRYTEAAQSYQNAIQTDPQSVSSYEGLGLVYMQQGKYQQAVNQFTTAIGFKESANLYFRLSDAYIELRDWQNVKDAAQNALNLQSGFAAALVNLGVAECYLGNGDAALSAWESAAQDAQWRSVANHHIEVYNKSGECP